MTDSADFRCQPDNTALLPCPFCGGKAAIVLGMKQTVRTVDVACQDCGGAMPAFCEDDAISDWNTRSGGEAVSPREPVAYYGLLPSPETMLTYASILEKPQYNIKNGIRYQIPAGEIVEAACMALRLCARRVANAEEAEALAVSRPHHSTPEK